MAPLASEAPRRGRRHHRRFGDEEVVVLSEFSSGLLILAQILDLLPTDQHVRASLFGSRRQISGRYNAHFQRLLRGVRQGYGLVNPILGFLQIHFSKPYDQVDGLGEFPFGQILA